MVAIWGRVTRAVAPALAELTGRPVPRIGPLMLRFALAWKIPVTEKSGSFGAN